jgi:hypothetical protein
MASELNKVLSQLVKIINYIKKNSALNARLPKALCNEMGSDHQNIYIFVSLVSSREVK